MIYRKYTKYFPSRLKSKVSKKSKSGFSLGEHALEFEVHLPKIQEKLIKNQNM